LVGVEADRSATDINGAHSGTAGAFDSNTFTTTRTSLDWLATLRARVGVTSDNGLFYGTGGLAPGRVTSGFDTSFSSDVAPPTQTDLPERSIFLSKPYWGFQVVRALNDLMAL
jgi:opacity protein-like surface antigen